MSVNNLIEELGNCSDPIVKRDSAEKLAAMVSSDDKIIKALANGLRCNDRGVKDICSRSLAKPPSGYELTYAKEVSHLIADNEIEIRNLASDILETIGKNAVPAILPYTDNMEADIRQFAIEILCKIGHRSASVKIMKLLDDENLNVRNAAIDALGNMKANESVERLIEMYLNEVELRPMIIESLGKIGGIDSLKFLTELLKSEDEPLLKLSCIDALAFECEGIDICRRLMNELPEAEENIQVYMLKTIFAISYRNKIEIELPKDLRHIAYRAIEDDDIDLRSAGLVALGNSYNLDDLGPLFIEMQRNYTGTQQLILSNLLIHSESSIVGEFFRRYCLRVKFDIEPIEFLSYLPFLWEEMPEDNKLMTILTNTELVYHPNTQYILEVMDILFTLDYKNVINKMFELIPEASSQQLDLMVETINRCSRCENVSVLEDLKIISEAVVARYKEIIN